jgi:hypothetical protein
MQVAAAQGWNLILKRDIAIVERQQGFAAKSANDFLLLFRQRAARRAWPHRFVFNKIPLAPLRNRLGVNPKTARYRNDTFFRLLYESSLAVRRRSPCV